MNTPLNIARPRDALPVDRVLNPKSIAIVGVSEQARSFGHLVLDNLRRFDYSGRIHLVSRSSTHVDGLPCLAAIDELPPGVDVAVLTIPLEAVIEAIQACGRREVAVAVIFASGFAEAGESGQLLQARLSEVARQSNVLVVGPNCMGLSNLKGGVPLTFEPLQLDRAYTSWLNAGEHREVAVIAQSGAMANNLRDGIIARGLPLAYAISTGNEAVLRVEDYLGYLLQDSQVQVVALYIEQSRHPRELLALAAQARHLNKRLVLVLPGRSSRARDAVMSHTGALTGNHATATTLLRAEGVAVVDTLDELLDCVLLLQRYPNPSAAGPALLTNSGAFKNCALDLAEDIGLQFPQFPEATVAGLTEILPGYAVAENPLDFTTISAKDPKAYGRLCRTVLADPKIGGLLLAMMPGPEVGQLDKAEHLVPALADCEKPTALILLGDQSPLVQPFTAAISAAGLIGFRSLDRALRAFHGIGRLARALGRERLALSARQVTLLEPNVVLAEHESKAWLSQVGISFPRGELARSLAAAEQIGARIGYPLVLKAQSRDLPHKTEAGGVVVGIQDLAQLQQAWARIEANVARARPGLQLDGLLVEAMGQPGVELIVGARRDAQWGPVVMVGLGGIWTEALNDVRLIAPDMALADIEQEILQLKGAALLGGLRGSAAVNVHAIAQVVAKVAALMRTAEEVSEIDINPLLAYPDRVVALDALVVTALCAEDDVYAA